MKKISVLLLILLNSNSAFATAISASLNHDLYSKVVGGSTQRQTDSISWSLNPIPLSLSTTATAADLIGNQVTIFETTTATWTNNGNAGFIDIKAGWIAESAVGLNNAVKAVDFNYPKDYSYTFIADFNGQFQLDYDITASGEVSGLSGWDIDWSGVGNGLTLRNANTPVTNGSFLRSIVAGIKYTIDLKNAGNLVGGLSSGQQIGKFNFIISPVPEPEEWAMMMLGLPLMGFVARRGRTA